MAFEILGHCSSPHQSILSRLLAEQRRNGELWELLSAGGIASPEVMLLLETAGTRGRYGATEAQPAACLGWG